ncbi:hypothetical protein TNCV_96731 [Trichonephila clavipes]|nr:hypothetical protein TNCV_96731 [Trichonephila clavipes]
MSATTVMLTIFWDACGGLYTEFLTKGLRENFNSAQTQDVIGKLKFTVVPQPLYSPYLAPFGLLVVPKIEGDVERSTFFNGCRSSGSRAQMDTYPIRIFLHGWNEEMDRTIEQMCSC